MFKACLKTYWKTFKYFLTVLGVIFLSLLIAGSVMSAGAGKSIAEMKSLITEVTEVTNQKAAEITDSFAGEEKSFSSVLDEGVQKGANFVAYAGEILAIIARTAVGIIWLLIGVVLLLLIGILLSHDIVFFFARYDIKERNILKVWLELVLRNMIILVSFLPFAVCALFWKPYGLILLALYPFLYCYLSLLTTWVTAGENRPSYREFVTFRNVIVLFAANIVELLITAFVAAGIFLLSNAVLAGILGYALLVMAAVSTSLNASAYLFGELEVSD